VKFRIADLLWRISLGSFELQTKFVLGGETASTGTKKLRLHTELLSTRKNDGNLNIIADDYEYALAA